MSTIALLVCLLVAEPLDPLEEVKYCLKELYDKDQAVATDAYRRLQVLSRSNNQLRACVAKGVLEDYDRLNYPLILPGGKEAPPKDRKPHPDPEYGLRSLKSLDEFFDKDKQPRYASPHLVSLIVHTKDYNDEHLLGTLGAKNLTALNLLETSATGRDLAKLQMPRLRLLSLAGSPVTDETIAGLKPTAVPKLEVLNLSGTKVTDKTLANLPFTNLSVLYFDGTAITRAEVARSLPKFTRLTGVRMDLQQFDPKLYPLIEDGTIPLVNLRLVHTSEEDRAAIEMKRLAPNTLTVTLLRVDKNPPAAAR
jgi:hypothetical protein